MTKAIEMARKGQDLDIIKATGLSNEEVEAIIHSHKDNYFLHTNKKYFYALGTMSGTSFDGVDAAIIKTDGQYYIKRVETSFIKYSNSEKLFTKILSKNYKKITKAIDNKHKQVIKKILKNLAKKVDIIGLHGQTFFHDPNFGWTWQYINSKKLCCTSRLM